MEPVVDVSMELQFQERKRALLKADSSEKKEGTKQTIKKMVERFLK